MNIDRFQSLAVRYRQLRFAVVGDFCLDRYLEIDPRLQEFSLETGLPVHNVVNVRAEPGGAGTILNNLCALGATVYPIGFYGVDGEGFELRRALARRVGVQLDFLIETASRRTFTYCKPLVVEPGQPPRELNRLDSKNWSATPFELRKKLADAVLHVGQSVDGLVVLEQTDMADTGVVTPEVLRAVAELQRARPALPIIADSRRGLRGYPPVIFKMNRREFLALIGAPENTDLTDCLPMAAAFARETGRPVFVTLAEQGMLGASPEGSFHHQPALPVRGPIDIVGAGDAVTANLLCALAAGATLAEAMEIAAAAASVVIHKLGVTGTATPQEIQPLLEVA
ncbi:PfkB family carbohydrate kinase [Fontisphaera persica]|uniref:bifunctional heptose 7-phosphate kinase/heptose 1-phosphate adenyltransferase n=1 Tax=Fontisphaera persica TaxID=2974023 RepID=UPI0024BFA7C8|nr:PfkB family carbohydrate kinase [Fontisphaera persica]WCJ60360.1 PfkB family carbohydrate kinase [Fontisphaera persica]